MVVPTFFAHFCQSSTSPMADMIMPRGNSFSAGRSTLRVRGAPPLPSPQSLQDCGILPDCDLKVPQPG